MKFNTEQFLIDFSVPYISSHATVTSKYLGLATCVFCGAKASGNRVYGAVGRDFTATACYVCGTNNFDGFLQHVTGFSDRSQLSAIYRAYGNFEGNNLFFLP